jgi:ribokinase
MVVKAGSLPAPGETVMGTTFLMNPGGKGANQAVAAARLATAPGPAVVFVAQVGDDVFGRQALAQFQHEGLDVAHVTLDPTYPSGVALITVDDQGENAITVAPGANHQLRASRVRAVLETAPPDALLLIQLEIPLPTVEAAVEAAAARGVRVILNPAPAQVLPDGVLRRLYLLTPNETEAEHLTGIRVTEPDSAGRAAAALLERGVAHVALTLGARGVYLLSAGEATGQLIPAPRVAAVDTTAAGDCFNGALAVALSEGRPLAEAAAFACRAAAVSVTRLGAQASMPTRAEVPG